MFKANHTINMKKLTIVTIVSGFFFCMSACLEKHQVDPLNVINTNSVDPFALFRIHLTLLDADTQEPLPALQIKLLNKSSITKRIINDVGQVTDSAGVAHLEFASIPLVPKEFFLSISDTTQTRVINQEYISVLFVAPVFSYIPIDAAAWGSYYQGTTELYVSRELKQENNE